MATATSPSVACIGIIGKHNNPLHISLFPPHLSSNLEFQFLLTTCLDIFALRAANKTIDQDLGLLQAVDERLACYGWLTNTGVKFVIVIDMAGREAPEPSAATTKKPIVGLRDSDLKPAFRALQTAYVRLLQDPFYRPDDRPPMVVARTPGARRQEITNKRFVGEVQRIGKAWAPGVTTV